MPHNFDRETPAEFEARTKNERAASILLDLVIGYPTDCPEFEEDEDRHVALEEADSFANKTERERDLYSAEGYIDLTRQYVAERPELADLLLRAKVEVLEGEA